ncbi:MAG: nuclear transport factor 2 family protein [Gammaproteobacteria bacterium]|nr:hypothetical protein [Gammaproteobacteria bacterium]
MKIWRVLLAVGLVSAGALVLAQSERNDTLEERLRKVEDTLAIQRVLLDYAVHLDSRNIDGYVGLFTEDGVWQLEDSGEMVRRGHAEIRAMLESIYGDNDEYEPFGYRGFRIIANTEVDVDGDRAVARSRHLSFMRGERGNPRPVLTGLYVDELVRVNGEWKIRRRVDYPIMPTSEEWMQQVAEMRARGEL